MSEHDNIQAARRLLVEGFGDGKVAVVDEVVALDFVEHQNGVQGRGPEAVKAMIDTLHGSFTGVHVVVQGIVAVGDDVWVRSRTHGDNTLPLMSMPATGRSIDIEAIDVLRFRDGKVAEHWGVADRLGMMQQLGLSPLRREPAA
jgi:predicted ester cyclase